MQFPNAPLLVAFGGWLVAALTDGSVHAYARAVFYVGLAVWAWGELTSGVNWARRALGAAGLVYVVIKVGAALGACAVGRREPRRGAWGRRSTAAG